MLDARKRNKMNWGKTRTKTRQKAVNSAEEPFFFHSVSD